MSAALQSRSSLALITGPVAMCSRKQQVHARRLVQRPVEGVPARAAGRRGLQFRVGERERFLADVPRDQAHQQVQVPVGAAGRAAVRCRLRAMPPRARQTDSHCPQSQWPSSSAGSCRPPQRRLPARNTCSSSNALTSVAATGPAPSSSGSGGDEQRTVLGPVGRTAVGALHQRCVERNDVHQIAHADHLLRQAGCDAQFRQPELRGRRRARPGRSPACGEYRRCARSPARGRRRGSGST